MITATVTYPTQLIDFLTDPSPQLLAVLRRRISALVISLEAHIKSDKLSGQVLNVKSGALRRSISHSVESTPEAVLGSVFSSGDVKYGRIHEYGGQTRPHDIYPSKASVLAFTMGGRRVFAKVVHHPGSKMPERSFMRSALADHAEAIRASIRAAVAEAATR